MRSTLECFNVTADNRSRGHDDPVVGVQRIDQRTGDGLADTRNLHTFSERNSQGASGFDDEIDGCRRWSVLCPGRRTEQDSCY